ncbi:MAG: hypothetical protein RL414_410 [Actinomycetota bacterium]
MGAVRGKSGLGDLQITNVTKVFRDQRGREIRALDGVSLDIKSGEFLVLLGPSGCGKTTLLRSIGGFENIDSGTITLGGETLGSQPPNERPVNTVFQSYALFPHMTVAENVAFGLQTEKIPREEVKKRTAEVLELVELSEQAERKPRQLSGGQQQRAALARALAKKPKVLLLDEPLAALDLKLRKLMQVELKRIHKATGTTFLFVTHDQNEAMAMGDRIAVFSEGKLQQVGTPFEIYSEPVNEFVATFVGESNFIEGTLSAGSFNGDGLTIPDVEYLSNNLSGLHKIAIRPESLFFDEGSVEIGMVEIRAILYAGDTLDIIADTPTGSKIKVKADAALQGILAIGDHKRLFIKPGSARLLR